MAQLGKFRDALALYRRHGWRLARALMTTATLAELRGEQPGAGVELRFEGVAPQESGLDAMWLSRASAGGREAWELRLVADTPYALFELFEPDEPEEDREDVRREMEARMRETMNAEPQKSEARIQKPE
ncbi:MAG: hypothetical protein LC800_18920 [Acidobacteria bacterium]|nr:hypothetical protein [Acidobacteriota bacterium]